MRMPQFALRNTESAISESMFVRSSAMGDGGAALVAICDAGSAAGWGAGLGWDPPEAHPRATRPATIAGIRHTFIEHHSRAASRGARRDRLPSPPTPVWRWRWPARRVRRPAYQ